MSYSTKCDMCNITITEFNERLLKEEVRRHYAGISHNAKNLKIEQEIKELCDDSELDYFIRKLIWDNRPLWKKILWIS